MLLPGPHSFSSLLWNMRGSDKQTYEKGFSVWLERGWDFTQGSEVRWEQRQNDLWGRPHYRPYDWLYNWSTISLCLMEGPVWSQHFHGNKRARVCSACQCGDLCDWKPHGVFRAQCYEFIHGADLGSPGCPETLQATKRPWPGLGRLLFRLRNGGHHSCDVPSHCLWASRRCGMWAF